jgi:fructokinase
VPDRLAIGIDLGGTKISGIVLSEGPDPLAKRRIDAPRENYRDTLHAVRDLVHNLETDVARDPLPVGIGVPGSISPKDGCLQGANSIWLNGEPLDRDLQELLGRSLRLANDANCFALSEYTDGAARGADTVFGVIIGTGCGGGIVRYGKIIDGPRGIGGEWGHNPLPAPEPVEVPGPDCWCGRQGCMETWVSGPGLEADYLRASGKVLTASDVASATDDAIAVSCLEKHASRLARGLAGVINLIDPDVIVLGGGLSNMPHLYSRLPELISPHIFATDCSIDIRPPKHGDDSGVRGAARLWLQNETSK